MRLFITPGSPYARMARITVLEKGLENEVEIVPARTRLASSPYYATNPSGRVPYLLRDDGVGLEESTLICDWLDRLAGEPMFGAPPGAMAWEARRLEALARSLLDGVSVWGREIARPAAEQSPTVIRHEQDRAARMVELWESEIGHAWMQGAFNLAQLTLGCALGMDARNPDFRWRTGHPDLSAWHDRIAARPSFLATLPPEAR